MADYFATTIIQPSIAIADMTALEKLLLTQIFESEGDGDDLYFFAETSPNEMFAINRDDLRAVLAADTRFSRAADFVRKHLMDSGEDADSLELDMTETSWEFIFQDVVARSSTLQYVSVVQVFTCSKLRPDGFSGLAVLITADSIRSKSTDDILDAFIAEHEAAAAHTAAPADGLQPEE